ncbi:MAG: hypothetical protein KGL41_06825 [Actinomycetales bacterium]|nr:hypothetical protein [Actinomycetales bacterium]
MKKLLSWFGVKRREPDAQVSQTEQIILSPEALPQLFAANQTGNDLILRRCGIAFVILGLTALSYDLFNALFSYGVYSLGWILLAIWALKRDWLGLTVLFSYFATFTLTNEVSMFLFFANGG